jgi:hypothetical protein
MAQVAEGKSSCQTWFGARGVFANAALRRRSASLRRYR